MNCKHKYKILEKVKEYEGTMYTFFSSTRYYKDVLVLQCDKCGELKKIEPKDLELTAK